MSAIAAIARFDGGPVERPWLDQLVESMSPWGPEGRAAWVDGHVGLGHLALATTPEAKMEVQPVRSPSGYAVGVVDARLDDRAGLVRALGWDRPLDVTTDPDLVLAAYDRWGEAVCEHLLGDFAYAIWDGRSQRLVCAKDHLGLRPLFYSYVPSTAVVLVASDPGALARHPLVPGGIDEGAVAEALASTPSTPGATLWRHVGRVPPAYALVADRTGVGVRRYWTPNYEAEPLRRQPQDYVEEYIALLSSAVQDRMRAAGPVVTTLSGGIDSSSISVLALEASKNNGALALEALSIVVPGVYGDESEWIQAVESHTGILIHRRRLAPRSMVDLDAEVGLYADLPDYPTARSEVDVLGGTTGRRVCLLGNGGDEWFTPCEAVLAELLSERRFIAYLSAARSGRREGVIGSIRQLALSATARPLLEGIFPMYFRKRDGRAPGPSLVHPSFARRVGLTDRLEAAPSSLRPTGRFRWLSVGGARPAVVYDRLARRGGYRNFVFRYPFLDRRVVEFGLRTPEALRWRNGEQRWIQRAAMAGRLPDSVRLRASKAELSMLLREEMDLVGGRRAFDDLDIGRKGWVDQKTILAAFDASAPAQRARLTSADRPSGGLSRLWNVLAVERWARQWVR